MKHHSGIREVHSNEIGMVRHDLYRGAIGKLNAAIANAYFIEAIAISESFICDRLESRVSFLSGDDELARRHSTLGALVRRLNSSEKKADYESLREVYDEINVWRAARNKAIHNIVKLTVGQEQQTWETRYNALKSDALEGKRLFQKLASEIEKLKRKENRKKTAKIVKKS